MDRAIILSDGDGSVDEPNCLAGFLFLHMQVATARQSAGDGPVYGVESFGKHHWNDRMWWLSFATGVDTHRVRSIMAISR